MGRRGRQDHYEVLGLNPDALDEVIRAAYRALASKYHPDRKPTACPQALSACVATMSCDVTLSNGICQGDPCVGTPKTWSVTITSN